MSASFFPGDLYKNLLDNLSEGVYFTDTHRFIQYWNKGSERITGYTAEEVVGKCCASNLLMHTDLEGNSLCHGLCPLLATIRDGEHRTAKVFLRHKEGHRVPVAALTAPIRDQHGVTIGGLETFHDVTSEMAALAQVEALREQTLLCPLTGVGNRRYAEQVLAQKFDEMSRTQGTLGIIFIDIDRFKTINDTYGHKVGDVALKMVARTLGHSMRSYDFIGRWGGEEFIAVLPNMHLAQLAAFADRLRALVEKSSANLSKGQLVVTISLGAVLAGQGDDREDVLKRADALMYRSKAEGRNRVTVG